VVRAPVAAARELVLTAFVEPVREGRLRGKDWPSGLRAVVGLALIGFVTAAALVLTARPIRTHSELTVGLGGELVFPRWALFLFLVLTALSLALVHAASLHLSWWLRLLVLLIVVVAVLTTSNTYLDQTAAPHVATWVGCALLVLLTAVRWRASFAWWEFVASFLVIGATVAAAFRSEGHFAGPLGHDTVPVGATLTMQALAILAAPFVFVSGVAFAQLALLMATRVGGVVDQRVRRGAWLVVLSIVLAAADLVLAFRRLRTPTEFGASHLSVALSGLGLVVVVVAWALAQVPTDVVDDLAPAMSAIAMPVAVLTTALVLVSLLVSRVDLEIVKYRDRPHLVLGGLEDAVAGRHALIASRFGVGLLLVGGAVWQRHRLPVAALLGGCVGLVLVTSWARRTTGGAVDLPWTSDSVNDAAALMAVVTLVVLATRRRLTRSRLLALGTALGVGLAWSVRSTFDAPFVALFGLGATAAVFLGLIWALLTGAGEANLDSGRYPRPSRVMFFLGNAVLAMSVLAFGALGRTQSVGLDTLAFGSLGDAYLGTGLLLAAYGLLAVAVVRDRAPLTAAGRVSPGPSRRRC